MSEFRRLPPTPVPVQKLKFRKTGANGVSALIHSSSPSPSGKSGDHGVNDQFQFTSPHSGRETRLNPKTSFLSESKNIADTFCQNILFFLNPKTSFLSESTNITSLISKV
jgi:hypothetical protein